MEQVGIWTELFQGCCSSFDLNAARVDPVAYNSLPNFNVLQIDTLVYTVTLEIVIGEEIIVGNIDIVLTK
jgi:hypothetical protein